MLSRCYSARYQERQPTYKGCTVCEEWLIFSKFREWMTNQDYKDKQLDKDFIIEGNKIYSPETCVFITRELNSFLTLRSAERGEYPLGVYWNKNSESFIAQVVIKGKRKSLGCFNSPIAAHQSWQTAKLKLAKGFLEEEMDLKVKQGLQRVISKLQYHIDNNIQTEDL